MTEAIIDLIHDYLEAAESGIEEMKRCFGVPNLLRARRQNLIPAQGVVQGTTTLQFTFHGIGCALVSDQYTVDFDFNEAGDCAGFDAWRLWQFAKSQPDRYRTLGDRDAVAQSLKKLEQAGQLQKTAEIPNPQMYRLKK